MILQALDQYYKRKLADPESNAPPIGWEWKEIPFLVVIDREGNFRALEDTREGEGRRKRAKPFLVPIGEKKSSGIKANLLWDNVEYVLGANPRNRSDIKTRHNAFKERIMNDLEGLLSEFPINTILKFLENSPLQKIESSVTYAGIWQEMLDGNVFTTFKIDGDQNIAANRMKDLIKPKTSDSPESICLITGEHESIARLHPAIKGVRGTNTTGGSIVSFNLDAFKSHKKDQGFNSPISESAAFSYTTALNILLGKDSINKTLSGDTTVVFWNEFVPTDSFNLEDEFAWFVADPPKDDPDRGIRAVKGLLEAMKSGHLPAFDDNRFYILGLSPNAARISIRYWRTGTTRDFGENILRHFKDIAIDRGPNDPEYLTLNQLLRSTALEYKMENVPPNMAGSVMTSILDGTPYPISLLQQCIRRIRAERHVSYRRASIIKGYLTRKKYFREGLYMSLDKENKDCGYLTGRLFAVLERIQEAANPGINATIRDRFYGAASTTPVTVFPRLLKLKNHHLSKLDSQGIKIFYEKKIGEIIEHIESLPRHLTLNEQAAFAIGYYHQRQDFFKKKQQNSSEEGSVSND